MNLNETIAAIVQLVTGGGFGALVWFLIVKTIPKIQENAVNERKEFLTEAKESRKEFLIDLKEQRTTFAEILKEQLTSHLESERKDREVFTETLKTLHDEFIGELQKLQR